MSTLMPTDDNNNPIPALRLKTGGAHNIVASTTSARNATSFGDDTQIISLYASVPVYVRFGDNTVTATSSDHHFPAGVYYDMAIGGEGALKYTNIAVLRADVTNGTVYVSEKI